MFSQRIYVYFISTLKNSTLPVRAGNVIYHKRNSKNKTNITLPRFAAMFYRKMLMISLVKSLTINQRNFVAVVFYKKDETKVFKVQNTWFVLATIYAPPPVFLIWYSYPDSCHSLLETSLDFVIISHWCCQIVICNSMPFVVCVDRPSDKRSNFKRVVFERIGCQVEKWSSTSDNTNNCICNVAPCQRQVWKMASTSINQTNVHRGFTPNKNFSSLHWNWNNVRKFWMSKNYEMITKQTFIFQHWC